MVRFFMDPVYREATNVYQRVGRKCRDFKGLEICMKGKIKP
jgi:hypothetical protein